MEKQEMKFANGNWKSEWEKVKHLDYHILC